MLLKLDMHWGTRGTTLESQTPLLLLCGQGENPLILFYYKYKHFVNIRKLFESFLNKPSDIYKTFLFLPFIWQTNVAHEINPTSRGPLGSLPQHRAAASPDPAVIVKASPNPNISLKFLNSDWEKVLEYGNTGGVCWWKKPGGGRGISGILAGLSLCPELDEQNRDLIFEGKVSMWKKSIILTNYSNKKLLWFGQGVCMTSLDAYFLIYMSNLLAYHKNKGLISTLK